MNNPSVNQQANEENVAHTYEQNGLFSHKSKSSEGSGRWLRWGTACHASMNIWPISSIQVKVGLSGISTWSTTEQREGSVVPMSSERPWLKTQGGGAGEMAPRQRTWTALLQNQSSAPRNHTGWLTTACASSSRELMPDAHTHSPVHWKDTELM